MGVDPGGGAGHEGDVIPAGDDGELVKLVGFDDENFLHLVGKHLIQNGDGERVALDQLIQIGEELCGGQSPVRRDDGVGVLPAHGK